MSCSRIDTNQFQSTPSARRATLNSIGCAIDGVDFNPRPPRGGRRMVTPPEFRSFTISIHALREEGDVDFCILPPLDLNFNPRPPRGGRQSVQILLYTDIQFQSTPSARRATCSRYCAPDASELFQSTPSARRATSFCCLFQPAVRFQSTPSARRATAPTRIPASTPTYFNPRPPRGGRPGTLSTMRRQKDISIHALREEGDLGVGSAGVGLGAISIHALREEGDGAGQRTIQ